VITCARISIRFGFHSADEPQIIEYQTQQYKLFPLLASAFAYWFAGMKMRNVYTETLQKIMKGDTDSLPEVTLLVVELVEQMSIVANIL
jgi:acyl-CoA oxidase